MHIRYLLGAAMLSDPFLQNMFSPIIKNESPECCRRFVRCGYLRLSKVCASDRPISGERI